MKTPFLARLPRKAPTNLWISGRPTVPSHFCLKVDNVEPEAVSDWKSGTARVCLTNWLQAGHLQPPRRPSTAPAAGEGILAQVARKIPLPTAHMCSRLLLARSDMRREAIDEAVAVRADFLGGTVKPGAFRRRGRGHP